ncbi:MAG: hypothetical protein JWO86_3426 [Myxococcaceae bacterium]|nr:hypothetical protein [Myxococcaceae bacterium]
MKKRHRTSLRSHSRLGIAVLGLGLGACGDRPASYDAPINGIRPLGLETSVALIDDGAHRVVLLTPHADQDLERTSVGLGKGVIRADTSPDGKRLFVLSTGDLTRKKGTDEKPSLTVIEGTSARRYALESPHSGLAIDPLGRWVAIFAAPASAGGRPQATFVENPNEIVLVDLDAPIETAVTPRTLRSFGGLPQRVSFTAPINLPGGLRRLMIVETDQDVALLDLDNVRATPQRPEVTVRLTSGATAQISKPGGVVVDDGEPTRNDDARIGIRLENGSNVVTLTLVPNVPDAKTDDPLQVPNDFRTVVNLSDVGGVPGDIVFVHTDVGIRLAAIVPSTRTAVLVDPETSVTTNVDLPEPYARISLITNAVGGAAGSDTALLYGTGGSRGVAFWSLGRATGQPYRSVEVVGLSSAIGSVLDVPPPRPELKVLESTGGGNAFFVLNLATRTASPLTTLGAASLVVSRDGRRLWAFQRGTSNLAQVSLADLHPIPLPLDRLIDSVFDVARPEGGRSLITIDVRGAGGATVLDALAPDTAASRSFYGFLLEDL